MVEHMAPNLIIFIVMANIILIFFNINIINHNIMFILSGYTESLDMVINNSKMHPLIKKILHTKQIIINLNV